MRSDSACLTGNVDHRLRRGLVPDERGVASIEFAMVLPVLLLMYLGLFDISQEITVSRKLGIVSSTVGSLVSAQPSGTATPASTISGIMAVSPLAMAPFAPGTLTVTVSAIDLRPHTDGSCCDATVNWSFTQAGVLRPCGVNLIQTPPDAPPSPTTIPSSLASQSAPATGTVPQSAVIVTDVTYAFVPIAPLVDRFLRTTLHRTSYVVPRQAGQIILESPVAAPTGQTGVVCP